MAQEKKLRQIKVSHSQHSMLKALARGEKTLRDVCEEAVWEFVDRRLHEKPKDNQYIVSPQRGNYQSYWFSAGLLAQVANVSRIDGISESRVIYTALFHYLKRQTKQLQPID